MIGTNTMMMKNRDIEKWAKYLLVLFALLIAFLFALNGRYEKDSGRYVFDKWRGKIIRLEVE